MTLPRDLKHYSAPDAFSILTPDAAIFWLCVLIALAAVFSPYFN